jgi:hypothetical protein
LASVTTHPSSPSPPPCAQLLPRGATPRASRPSRYTSLVPRRATLSQKGRISTASAAAGSPGGTRRIWISTSDADCRHRHDPSAGWNHVAGPEGEEAAAPAAAA